MKCLFAKKRSITTGLLCLWASFCTIKAQSHLPGVNSSSDVSGFIQSPQRSKSSQFNFDKSAYHPPSLQKPIPVGYSKTIEDNKNPKSGTYRIPTGKSIVATHHKGDVSELKEANHHQDLRLGKIERDVGLLSNESGGLRARPEGDDHYVVKPGDTLFSIAARRGTSVGELRSLNHLVTDRADIGTNLLLPKVTDNKTSTLIHSTNNNGVSEQPRSELIKQGYSTSENSLAKDTPNGSTPSHSERLISIKSKQLLLQTIAGSSQAQGAGQDIDHGNDITQSPRKIHIVRKGESLSKIASTHRVSVSSIMKENLIENPNKIMLGQRLLIPENAIAKMVSTKVKESHQAPSLGSSDTLKTPANTKALAPHRPSSQVKPSAVTNPPPRQLSSKAMRGVVAYRMQRGDSLEGVASFFSTTVENIRALNKHLPSGNPQEGTEVYVPTVGAVSLN
jgi:LysM repeat protein